MGCLGLILLKKVLRDCKIYLIVNITLLLDIFLVLIEIFILVLKNLECLEVLYLDNNSFNSYFNSLLIIL